MMYRSDFSDMADNIDLAIKLLLDVKGRINDIEAVTLYNESNATSLNDRNDYKNVPSVATALAEIRTARKLLSETAMELDLGKYYTGRELEDN